MQPSSLNMVLAIDIEIGSDLTVFNLLHVHCISGKMQDPTSRTCRHKGGERGACVCWGGALNPTPEPVGPVRGW